MPVLTDVHNEAEELLCGGCDFDVLQTPASCAARPISSTLWPSCGKPVSIRRASSGAGRHEERGGQGPREVSGGAD